MAAATAATAPIGSHRARLGPVGLGGVMARELFAGVVAGEPAGGAWPKSAGGGAALETVVPVSPVESGRRQWGQTVSPLANHVQQSRQTARLKMPFSGENGPVA